MWPGLHKRTGPAPIPYLHSLSRLCRVRICACRFAGGAAGASEAEPRHAGDAYSAWQVHERSSTAAGQKLPGWPRSRAAATLMQRWRRSSAVSGPGQGPDADAAKDDLSRRKHTHAHEAQSSMRMLIGAGLQGAAAAGSGHSGQASISTGTGSAARTSRWHSSGRALRVHGGAPPAVAAGSAPGTHGASGHGTRQPLAFQRSASLKLEQQRVSTPPHMHRPGGRH